MVAAKKSRGPAAVLLALAFLMIPALGVPQHTHPLHGVPRKPIDLFVGVQTGFGKSYLERREGLRETWFPATPDELKSLEREQSIALRFVIGGTDDIEVMKALNMESKEKGAFLRLPYQERYKSLTRKTHVFFGTVLRMYHPSYIMKADDDVYMQLDRLPLLMPQLKQMQKDYIGCFVVDGPVITDGSKFPQWVEPQHSLFGSSYGTYARGPSYLLSEQAATWLTSMPPRSLRYFRSEDVTMGQWMATFNGTHFDDRRLCASACSPTSVIVNPGGTCTHCSVSKKLLDLHAKPECSSAPAVIDALPSIPLEEPHVFFKQVSEDVELLPGSFSGNYNGRLRRLLSEQQ